VDLKGGGERRRYKLPEPDSPEGEPQGKPLQITATRGSGRRARGKAGTNYRVPRVRKGSQGGSRYKLPGPEGPEGEPGKAGKNYRDPRVQKGSQGGSRYKLPGPEGPEGEPGAKPVQITGTRGSGRGARGEAATNYRDPRVRKGSQRESRYKLPGSGGPEEGGREAATNYRDPAVWKEGRVPAIEYVMSLSVVPSSVHCTN